MEAHTHTYGERVRATTPCNNSNNHNEGNLFEIQSKTLENHTHKVILILLQRNNICNPNNHISTTWRAHTHTTLKDGKQKRKETLNLWTFQWHSCTHKIKPNRQKKDEIFLSKSFYFFVVVFSSTLLLSYSCNVFACSVFFLSSFQSAFLDVGTSFSKSLQICEYEE